MTEGGIVTGLWDTAPLAPTCIVCAAAATVNVINPAGDNLGPHCGVHADEIVNRENEPLRKAANPQWHAEPGQQNAPAV